MTEFVFRQLRDRLNDDLLAFVPELILCGAIVLLLFLRMLPMLRHSYMGWVALVLTLLAFAFSVLQWMHLPGNDPRVGETTVVRAPYYYELFGGMLVFDDFTIWLKLFLLLYLAAVILLCRLTGIPDREDSADFFTLLIGATIGMMLMTSANHLLMAFLAVEMTSLPSYALAGFLKGRRQSSEAALKYVVYGGGSAGVMLFGISLVSGKVGGGFFPRIFRAVWGGALGLMGFLGGVFFVLWVSF